MFRGAVRPWGSDGRDHWLFDGFLFIEYRDTVTSPRARRTGVGSSSAISDLYRPRLYSYLRAFEVNGVRDDSAMAYYEGGGALLDMFHSSDAKCRADYQVIADWVIGRQSRSSGGR